MASSLHKPLPPTTIVVVIVIIIVIVVVIIIVVVVVDSSNSRKVSHNLNVDHCVEHEVDGGCDHQSSEGEEREYSRVVVAANLNHLLPLLLLLFLLVAVAV